MRSLRCVDEDGEEESEGVILRLVSREIERYSGLGARGLGFVGGVGERNRAPVV